MRLQSWYRILATAIATSTLVFAYFWFRHGPDVEAQKQQYVIKHIKEDVAVVGEKLTDIPSPLRDYCAFALDTGSEGQVKSEKLTLRGLFIVHRHGDRSPIVPILHHQGARNACGLHETRDVEEFFQYQTFVGTPAFQKLLSLHPDFRFPPVPAVEECGEGEMTAFGALQLLRTGRHFRDRYTDFFQPGLNSSLWATPYARTFQSAVAFLSGVFRDSGLGGLRLQRSPNTHFCRARSCLCPAVPILRSAFESRRFQLFKKSKEERLKEAVANIAENILGRSSIQDPLSLFDTLMGAFVCRRAKLPCVDGNCALYSHILAMQDFHTERMAKLAAETGGDLQRLSAGESLPILRFRDMRIGGHDVTVRPLLISLGLFNGGIPHYGARLVLEMYRLHPSNALLLRVLYDGRDLTSQVSFCRDKLEEVNGMKFCPLTALKTFLRDQLLPNVGARDLADLCTPS